jgi:hypothetical protein
LIEQLCYGLSMPERGARSATALLGGLLQQSTARLLPGAFRSSRSYGLFVKTALDFLTHQVGGVRSKNAGDDPAANDDQFIAKKTVGGLLDIASLATLHVSPAAVLALISDIGYGSSTFLRQLGEELKEQGVIAPDSTIDHAADLLSAVERAAGTASGSLDRPPLNVEGLKQTIAQTREALNRIDPTKVLPSAELDRLWNEMQSASKQENASLMDVSATMAMHAMNRVQMAGRGALATLTVAGNLFDQQILDHYRGALDEIRTEGLYKTLATASEPYLDAVWDNFSYQRATITEQLLNGQLFSNALGKIKSWWN